MKALRALDNYFIGTGEGAAMDRVWALGQYVVYIGITLFTILAVY